MISRHGEVSWLNSYGGPLLLLSAQYLSSWHGIDPTSDDEPTDYDRACEATEYIEPISIGDGFGLVLGDEPLSTSWRSLQALALPGIGGILVGWHAADGDDVVEEVLRSIPDHIWRPEGFVFEVENGPLYLIDSGSPGDEVGEDDHLVIQLPPGTYSVATAFYKPNDRTRLLLQRLMLV